MTKDEIIKMAREAGFGPSVAWKECTPPFERFAALVAAAERASLAEPEPVPEMWGSPDGYWVENQYLYLRSDRECFTIPLYTAPPARRSEPEPESEPVAVRWRYPGCRWSYDDYTPGAYYGPMVEIQKLYA